MESWFKVDADIFDNKKMKIIRSMRNGDSMALIWFFLLSLARQQNDDGYIYATEGVAYTAKTLAACGGFRPKVTEAALSLFREYNMINVEENGYIYIVGWQGHQNTEALAKLKDRDSEKEKNRQRVAKHRQKQKQSNVMDCNAECNDKNITCNADVMDCNAGCNDKNIICNVNVMACNGNNKIKKENKNENKNKNNHYSNAECNGSGITNLVVSGSGNDNLIGFWNQNITPITPYIAERLQTIAKEQGELIAMQAVTITAQQGKKSIAYCEGVARNLASGDNQKPKKPPDDFNPPDDQTDLDKYF